MLDENIRMQTADPNRIICRDCIYRDRETMTVDGKEYTPGVTRATCLIYDGKNGNLKPNGVCFQNQWCDFYEKDDA